MPANSPFLQVPSASGEVVEFVWTSSAHVVMALKRTAMCGIPVNNRRKTKIMNESHIPYFFF